MGDLRVRRDTETDQMTLWRRESQSNWSFWWREIGTERQFREIDQMKLSWRKIQKAIEAFSRETQTERQFREIDQMELWLGGETEIKADQLKLSWRETDTERQFREIDQMKLWLGGGERDQSWPNEAFNQELWGGGRELLQLLTMGPSLQLLSCL